MTNSYLTSCKLAFQSFYWRFMTLAIISLLAFSTTSYGQYTPVYVQNGGYPGGIISGGVTSTTGWTELVPASAASNVWSASAAIPFAFDFYGTPVTHFKVSNNGLLTFDTTVSGAAPGPNAVLPSAGLPNLTIASYWDDFTLTPPAGTNDRVWITTEGTAPNRQLMVKWFSYEWASLSFVYVGIILEESTNIVYTLDLYSSAGGSTTVGLQQNTTTATFVGDNIPFAGNSSATAQIDYYAFYPPGFCIAPSTLSTNNITTNSATGVWTSNNSGANFELELGAAGFTQGTGTKVLATDTFYNVTGLAANTQYDWYVRQICGAGDTSTWSGPSTFRTLCNAFAVPFNETFDAGSLTEDCWTILNVNGDADTWGLNNTTNAFSGQSAAINTDFNAGNNDDYLITPALTLTGNERIRYQVRARSATEPNDYEVLVSTTGINPSDFSTLVFSDTVSATTYFEQNINLSAFSGPVYIAFRIPSGGLDGWILYIDEVNVEAIPSCPRATALSADSTNATSTLLSWTNGGSETSWAIEYGLAGFTPGTGTSVVATTNPYSLTGLTSLTAYDVYIRSICGPGDTSIVEGPISFTTLPNGAQGVTCTTGNPSIVYSTDFEDLNGWTGDVNLTGTPANSDWGLGNGGSSNTGPTSAFSGSPNSNMYFEGSSTTVPNIGEAISPKIDLTSASGNAEVSFWLFAYGADMGTLEVGLSNSATGPFNVVFTLNGQLQTSDTENWVNVGLDASTYVGDSLFISFKQTDGAGFAGDIYIDLLEVTSCLSCAIPSSLALSNVGATSVDLSWTETGTATQWQYSYGAAGFSAGAGTQAFVTSIPATISGLTPETAYDFYVRSVCGAGDTSAWSSIVSVTTPCAASLAPWSEGFTGLANNSIPSCWVESAASGGPWRFTTTNPDFGNNVDFPDHTFGTTNNEYVWVDMSGTDVGVVLETPIIDVSALTNPELVFYVVSHNNTGTVTTYNILNVEAYNGLSWDSIDAIQGDFGLQWQKFSYNISSNVYNTDKVKIRFRQESGGDINDFDNDMLLDDVSVAEAVTCPEPSIVTVDTIAQNSAYVAWIEAGSATNWELQYGVSGFTPGSGIFVQTSSNPYQLTGLTANTAYDVYVRSICGPGDTSLWKSVTFQTACGSFAAPFSEDFEAASPSISCWINEFVAGTDVWGLGAGSSGGAITAAQNGSLNARFTSSNGGPFVTKLVSPVIDMSSASAPELTFWYGQEVWFGDQNTLAVYYRISPNDPWVFVWSDSTDRAAWTDTTITLPNVSPAYQVAFEGTNNWGRANVVDNVTIGGVPTLSPIDIPITFDDPNVNYTLTDFGGNVSSVVVDPTDPTNTVGQADKTVAAQVWAGTTMGDVAVNNAGLATALPFSAGNTTMTVRVWSPDAGTPILLKVEDASDPTKSVETLVSTTAAATWETLTFDFSNQAPNTQPINFSTTYNKISIFFNFGTDGATAGAKTYYWDDVLFGAPSSSNDVCANALPITTNGLYFCDTINSGGTANHANATHARWFYFDAPSAGSISVDACGTGVDTRLWIMTGTCGATVDVAADDDGCGPTFESVILGFPVNSGTRYYIQWDDRWSSDPFDFLFTFNACAAPSAVNVTNVTGTSADINFTSTATTELEWGPAGFVQGTGTLISPATSPESLSGLTNATTYGFYLRQICGAGDTSLWDGPFSFTTNLAPCAITSAPTASDVDVCVGSSATLTATLGNPNNSAAWYTSLGGPIVSISNPFTTPAITSNATYYVAEANGTGGVQTHVGPAAPTGTLTFPGANFSNGQWFTVSEPLTIDSMTLVVNGPLDGSINISTDAPASGGVLLQSFNYSLPGAGTFQIPVDVILSAGNYYMNLGASTGTGVLFRSTGGANFPSYNIPGVVSIDSSNFGGGAAGVRYYYFWDWVVNSGCTGPVDSVAVTAIPTPGADFTFNVNGLTVDFTSVVNNPDSVTWDFGDGNTVTGLNPTNIYATAGTYNVSMTAHLGDCDSTITKDVSPTVGLNRAFNNSVSLYPNPSNGTFIVDAQGLSFDRLEVRDMLGKVVFVSNETFSNKSEITISDIATGNYIVTLINDEGMAIKQLTIK